MNATVVNGAATAAIIAWIVSVAKPFVEQLPFARTDSPTHDATLQLGQLAVNLLTVFALAMLGGTFTSADVLPLIVQGFAQAAGAEVLYKTVTRSGGSVRSITTPTAAPQPSPVATALSDGEMPTLQVRAVGSSRSGL